MGENPLPKYTDENLRSMGVALTMGFGVAVSLVGFTLLGLWIDQKFDTEPLWMLVGLVLGILAAGYQLWELVLAGKPDRENGPLGRSLQRTFSSRS